MALVISFRCVNCWACVAECPEKAIKATEPVFHIDQQSCNECGESKELPICISVCPVENAITDRYGQTILKESSQTSSEVDKLTDSVLDIDNLRLYEEWLY